MKDLHLHLSGGPAPALLFEILVESGRKMKIKSYRQFLEVITMNTTKIKNTEDYLEINHLIDKTQSSPRAVELSVYDTFKNAFLNGCDYLELRWNPFKRSQDFQIDLDKIIIASRNGFERANSIFGINGSMIFCLGRDCTEEQNESIFKKAIQYYRKGVTGLDVAGLESKVPLKPEFKEYYKVANAMGLVTTIHCGEQNYEGVDDVLAIVLKDYKPNRLGHGIQIHRYPKLMQLASNCGVVLEICISSNLMTRVVSSHEEFFHIFKTLEEYQLKYVLCTDATFPLNTNISREHEIYRNIMSMKFRKN
jgi:adenosine deaminase